MSNDHDGWYSEGDERYLDFGPNYRFELGRAGAVGSASWEKMGQIRRLYADRVAESIGEIDYARVTISRKRDPDTGELKESVLGGPFIALDPPLMTHKLIGKVSLLTWTSKMSAPSFSLPAGPMKNLGTCPASLRESVQKAGQYQFDASGGEEMHEVIPENVKYLCENCYAGKNNYLMYKQVSLGQVARLAWVNSVLRRGGYTALAQKFIEVIASLQDASMEQVEMRKLISNQYFRIHDAGDFHKPEYYLAWREVCYALPDIKFWAPTRQWVFQDWRDLFRNYPPPENLALRPSALFFGARPPVVEGMGSAGSTAANSIAGEWESISGVKVWNCPAYAADKHSCASAINPEGVQGCRTCWRFKDVAVNYKAH